MGGSEEIRLLSFNLSRLAHGVDGNCLGGELKSSITVFSSPMIIQFDYAETGKAATYVVERNKGVDTEDFSDLSLEAFSRFGRADRFDGVLVYVNDVNEHRSIYIGRTSRATTPLYIAVTNKRVYASWDFWWVVDRLPSATPDLDICQRFIIEGPCLYNETMVEGVHLLLGGQAAIIGNQGINLTDPNVSGRFEPSALRPEANATCAFLDLIADSMRDVASTNICLELSGGYDSSCIAGACHRAGIKIPYSYGIIQSGIAGRQQMLRRAELIDMIGIKDYELPSSICTPFSALASDPSSRVAPYDEIYRSAIARCVAALPLRPDVVVSGLGGDELTMEDDHEPLGSVGEEYDEPLVRSANLLLGEVPRFKREINSGPMGSSALGSICRSDLFMSLGIWPKAPLAEPDIVRFGELLPSSLRRGRTLNVLALAKLQLSDFFILTRYKENFKIAFESDLREFDVDRFFCNGFVQEYGLASISVLSAQHEKFINSGRCDIPLIIFANLVLLERNLKRMHNRNDVLH